MGNRAPRRRRPAVLAAAGLLAAGALTGCKTGAPYAYTGVTRGDAGAVPMSPAFAHVAAGQKMPADLKFVPGAPTIVIPSGAAMPPADGQSVTTAPGTPMIMAPMPAGQPLVGSGGVVYPAGGPAP